MKQYYERTTTGKFAHKFLLSWQIGKSNRIGFIGPVQHQQSAAGDGDTTANNDRRPINRFHRRRRRRRRLPPAHVASPSVPPPRGGPAHPRRRLPTTPTAAPCPLAFPACIMSAHCLRAFLSPCQTFDNVRPSVCLSVCRSRKQN